VSRVPYRPAPDGAPLCEVFDLDEVNRWLERAAVVGRLTQEIIE